MDKVICRGFYKNKNEYLISMPPSDFKFHGLRTQSIIFVLILFSFNDEFPQNFDNDGKYNIFFSKMN